MRSYSPATLAAITSRTGVHTEMLLWVRALDLTTGAEDPLGLWTGDQTSTFVIGGVPRVYAGEGAMLPIEEISYQVGTSVHQLRVTLNPLHPITELLLRGRNTGLVKAELHRAVFDLDTGNLVDTSHRMFKGQVQAAAPVTPEVGGEAICEMVLASSASALQKTLSATKSDEIQRLRSDDRILRYQAVSGSVKVWWGAVRS